MEFSGRPAECGQCTEAGGGSGAAGLPPPTSHRVPPTAHTCRRGVGPQPRKREPPTDRYCETHGKSRRPHLPHYPGLWASWACPQGLQAASSPIKVFSELDGSLLLRAKERSGDGGEASRRAHRLE